jgi:hypothetical protein
MHPEPLLVIQMNRGLRLRTRHINTGRLEVRRCQKHLRIIRTPVKTVRILKITGGKPADTLPHPIPVCQASKSQNNLQIIENKPNKDARN